jgi:hypothetical protein
MDHIAEALRGTTEDAEYHAFLHRVNARFAVNTSAGARPVFTTEAAENLWADYLASFGWGAERQHHNCHACRQFIERYGSLVTIEPDGRTKSAVWDEADAPELYKPAVAAMANAVGRAKVTGVFLTSASVWGQPETGVWQHLHVIPAAAMLHKRSDKTADQVVAEKREDFGMLLRALSDYSVIQLMTAVALLKSEALYRGEKVLGAAEWLLSLKRAIDSAQTQNDRIAGTWLSVAAAPAGFCHVRNSMIGSLLDDIVAGLPMADVKRRFDSKMSPTTYQRAQVAPTAGAIVAAEKLVEKLGIAPSLPRRYARLIEVPALWAARAIASPVQAQPGAVFGHIAPKAAEPVVGNFTVPGMTTMTWEKFNRTLLTEAISIEAQVPISADRFAALVTAVDATAPPILQWDNDGARNPFSWYYASGVDAEIKRRVLGAGGQHADVDIRASLIWNNRNDLDLHVLTPSGAHIYFGNKRANSGWLDIDMNVSGETTSPIENTRWPRGTAAAGRYLVYVENYRFHEHRQDATPFRVELEVNGEVLHFDGYTEAGRTSTSSRVIVADLHYNRMTSGVELAGALLTKTKLRRAATDANSWNMTPGAMVKVNAIVPSPNLWGDKPLAHHGRHLFFVLDGCRDLGEGRGRGFFTEMLKSELHQARSTIEAYNAGAVIADGDKADVCGLGMSDKAPWDLVLRVKTAAGTHAVKIDRWD